ncbi:MAG: hypothetical protein KAG95_01940 [Bacteroidales bacterium]|nr:hypothetical protein [Bacteroidales bacterium]
MKKLFLLMTISAFLFACGNNGNKTKQEQTNKVSQEIIKLDIDTFLIKASNYVGQEIELTGTVNHVCEHGAKRLQLMGSDPDQLVKVESGDKIEKFDETLNGSEVCVKGVVKEIVIDEAYITEMENKENSGDHHDLAKMQALRDEIKASGSDHISFYYLTGCNEYKVVE